MQKIKGVMRKKKNKRSINLLFLSLLLPHYLSISLSLYTSLSIYIYLYLSLCIYIYLSLSSKYHPALPPHLSSTHQTFLQWQFLFPLNHHFPISIYTFISPKHPPTPPPLSIFIPKTSTLLASSSIVNLPDISAMTNYPVRSSWSHPLFSV